MVNYLEKNKHIKKQSDLKDYSLSNNNITDEYSTILSAGNKDKILELISNYPDCYYKDLIELLEKSFKINRVILGSGSEDLIIRINSILKNCKKVAIVFPNFYRTEETIGCCEKIYADYSLNSKFLDIESIYRQIKKDIGAVWISNPNPMIGKLYRKKQIVDLVKKYKKTLFIIDESAIDFIKSTQNFSVIDIAQKLNNLIVIRSFSKLYGIAGLRAGFATGKTKFLDEVKNNGLTFPINSLADYFIKNILADKNINNRIIDKIEKHKSLIKNLLSKDSNIIFSESITNCLFLKHKNKDIFSELLKIGIIGLKLDEHKGIKEKGFVRITIHSSEKLYKNLFVSFSKFLELK